MVVAWLPDGVAWQPYGPFAEPRSPIVLASGFCVGVGRCIGHENLLGLCYILTKVEAASLSPASSVV